MLKNVSPESLPHLRVRSEYSYGVRVGVSVRGAHGKPKAIVDRLLEIGARKAALVDRSGTWGHVDWEANTSGVELEAFYGTEFEIPNDGKRPNCWVIATDTRKFYRFSSAAPDTQEAFANSDGIIRFAGSALTDPECFDYVDIHQCSLLDAERSLKLAKATKKPLILCPINDYPAPEHRQAFLAWADDEKMFPQHIMALDEWRSAFWFLNDDQFNTALKNTIELGERLESKPLPRAPVIEVPGASRFLDYVESGKRSRLERGHIKVWTDKYEERLQRELKLIHEKEYASYFLVVADLVQWAKKRMLVGPARGSSAGSLVCYLLDITEVDPLVHGLLFERFIDINRNDLPDIDIDFNDEKRPLVFDYLAEQYGAENVARIGSINTLKPRSVMAHVGRKMGIPHGSTFAVLNVLIEYSSGDARFGKGLEDTLENTQPGRDFTEQFPEARLMGELEGTASHTGQHAAGVIVSNEPVVEYCTVRDGIAHVDKKGAEELGLLKIDVLGLRTLGVIEDAGCITPNELYNLTYDDPKVFEIFNREKFSGVFQFEGATQRQVANSIPIDSFEKIDHITALARPGPLGGGAAHHYIARNNHTESVEYRHPSMDAYLKDTYGVVLYQEQVMRIVREIGKFSWEDTSTIRKAMSGRKGEEFFDRHGERFIEGAATHGIQPDTAKSIWNEICSFGAWGMNASHTCSYAMISYWCAYMKCYHPLEYAAACLRHAKDDEQTVEILRELNAEGVGYTPFDPQLSEANWAARDGKLLGGYTNLVGIGPVKAAGYINKRKTEGLDEKDLEKLSKLKVKHSDLKPAHTLWGAMYEDPESYNVHGRIKEFGELIDGENAVVIAKVVRKERRDENEGVRVARRNGKRYTGQTLFLDVFMVDDSVTKPVRVRVRPRNWHRIGIPVADKAIDGEDWFLIRGRWLREFSMMIVEKIKCLTNREMFV